MMELNTHSNNSINHETAIDMAENSFQCTSTLSPDIDSSPSLSLRRLHQRFAYVSSHDTPIYDGAGAIAKAPNLYPEPLVAKDISSSKIVYMSKSSSFPTPSTAAKKKEYSSPSPTPSLPSLSGTNLEPNMNILSDEQKYVYDLFCKGNNLFISGPGGSGKSFLIEYFAKYLLRNQIPFQITSTTGCSSVLLGENLSRSNVHVSVKTIHSWSGIRLCQGNENDIIYTAIKNKNIIKQWKQIRVLIIDEVSMLSCKMFSVLESLAQKARKSVFPFGGIQVILLGDMYQLAPVGNDQEPDTSKFCFESPQWSSVFPLPASPPNIDEVAFAIAPATKSMDIESERGRHFYLQRSDEVAFAIAPATKSMDIDSSPMSLAASGSEYRSHIELHTIYRQKDDKFKEILNEIRIGKLSAENKSILQGCVGRTYDPNGVIPLKILSTRAEVERHNRHEYNKNPSPEKKFVWKICKNCCNYVANNIPISMEKIREYQSLPKTQIEREIQVLAQSIPVLEEICLKRNSPVMCMVNLDLELGISNGTLGKVIDFVGVQQYPKVEFSNGSTYIFQPYMWQSSTYPCIGISQIPLSLSYANTIHKLQGATIDMAEMNLGHSIFTYGQIYVGLSRVRSLDGLYLTAFHAQKIKVNPVVQEFYERISSFLC